jgi:DNA repair exonuclease SbcCD ATPase subunit
MNQTNPARLSMAELRSRLLTHPASAAPLVYPTEQAVEPPIPPSLARRQPAHTPTYVPEIPQRSNISRPTPIPDLGGGIDLMEMARSVRSGSGSHYADQYDAAPGMSVEEASQLHAELQDLRTTVAQYKSLLEQVEQEQQGIETREETFQKAIRDRDQMIDELQIRIQKLDAELKNRPVLKNAEELAVWNDELEREQTKFNQEKKRYEEERKQLREDEESLERQMRDQEISMARERALMARQETELKRLSAEIQQELEIVQRSDSGLRDRMAKFQRRHQEVLAKAAGIDPSVTAAQNEARSNAMNDMPFDLDFLPAADAPLPEPPSAESADRNRKDTRMMRRLFGNGKQ